jgi:hypothetical protein
MVIFIVVVEIWHATLYWRMDGDKRQVSDARVVGQFYEIVASESMEECKGHIVPNGRGSDLEVRSRWGRDGGEDELVAKCLEALAEGRNQVVGDGLRGRDDVVDGGVRCAWVGDGMEPQLQAPLLERVWDRGAVDVAWCCLVFDGAAFDKDVER